MLQHNALGHLQSATFDELAALRNQHLFDVIEVMQNENLLRPGFEIHEVTILSGGVF